MLVRNRIVHISFDKHINDKVNFEGDALEESLYAILNALGIEVVITSEDEEFDTGEDVEEAVERVSNQAVAHQLEIDEWIKEKVKRGKKKSYFKYYTDYSIGFTTRGCFRQCEFCVNKNEKKVYPHSPLSEFVDDKRKKIC